MPTDTDRSQGPELPEPELPEPGAGESPPLFIDAATRVSNPSAFDTWYYGIEDKLGQGTIGMGVCLIVFILILTIAITCQPI